MLLWFLEIRISLKKTCTIEYLEIYFTKNSYHTELCQLRDISKGVCERSIHERALLNRKLHVNEQDSQFPGSHWVMVYQDKKKNYFIDSFGRDSTHYGFKFKRPIRQVFNRLQCLDSKLCGACLVFFWMQIGKRIRLEQQFGLLYMGLQI